MGRESARVRRELENRNRSLAKHNAMLRGEVILLRRRISEARAEEGQSA